MTDRERWDLEKVSYKSSEYSAQNQPQAMHTSCARSKEGPENHQGRDQLLATRRDIPSSGRQWIFMPKDLTTIRIVRYALVIVETYLQESLHRLKTANDTKVHSILEWAHGHERACCKALPMSRKVVLSVWCW